MSSPDQNGRGALTSLDRLDRAFRKSIFDRHGRGQMEVRRIEHGTPGRTVAAGSRAGLGPPRGVYSFGMVAPVQHEGTTESPSDIPRLQRRQDASLHGPESRDKSRKTKWRTLLSVAVAGGVLVALARAIKCIHKEVEIARRSAGSSSRRLGGGGGWECEEQENSGWAESRYSDSEAEASTESSALAGAQTLPSRGRDRGDWRTRGAVDEGSEDGSTGAGESRKPLVAEQFAGSFWSHLELLSLRSESAFERREFAELEFVLVACQNLKNFLSRPHGEHRLTVREKQFLRTLQAMLELELELLAEEIRVPGNRHSNGVMLMLEGISTLFERDEAAAAEAGSGRESGEAGDPSAASSHARGAASGHAAAVEMEADFFWGNTRRVLAAIRQFSTTLRRLRKQEWLLSEGAFTQARVAARIRELRGELLDDVTICVSPGTEPLEHRVTFNYLDAYLLGLFRFFLSSEMEFLQMFPDSALEDRILLLLDLVSQLSRDHRVPHPGP